MSHVAELVVIIRPSFKRFCEGDACRAALYNHLLYRIAKKAKGASIESVQRGDIFWYGSAEDICKDMDEDWCVNKIRKEIKNLVTEGILGQRRNPANGWDQRRHYYMSAEEGAKLLEKCKKLDICLQHIGLTPDVHHLLNMVNAFDIKGKCKCQIHEMDLPKVVDASTINGNAITKGTTKDSSEETNQEKEDGATAHAGCDYSSFLSELALSEIRMDAMLDTIVNSPPPMKAEPVEEEPPQEPVQTPPQKPNIRIVPIAIGTTNTPPPDGKGNRGRKQSVQLTLQGQHIHEVYQTFKERKIALTESTIKAANGLGDVVEDDTIFIKVLEAIRDNAFLKERKVGTDLDFVYRKYDSYVDIIKRPEEPQKTGSSQKTPPPQTEKKTLTPEQQARLDELLAKRRADAAQPAEMRA